jgi:NADH-quinone oxidoreductase subunit L
MTFFGEYKGNASHGHDDHGHGHDKHAHAHVPHESPASMWIPLAILALLSLGGQYIFNVPHILEPMFPIHEGGEAEHWLEYVIIAVGLGGIGLAYVLYVLAPGIPDTVVRTFSVPYNWIYNKYFVDEFYDSAIISPAIDGSRNIMWRVFDVRGIDGIANGIGTVAHLFGSVARRAQSGYIRNYAAWVVAGAIVVIVWVGLKGGVQ